jgi:hypothetical protein
MTKYKLEYIWLDGKKPVPELRGKTLLKSFEKPPTLPICPIGALTAVPPCRPRAASPTAC